MENGAQMDYTWYPVYDRIVSQIDELLAKEKNRQVTVAIDGMCGSGKSTLGQALKDHYGCNLFHMDDFYLRMEQRTPERYAEPGGNVDYERFQAEVLRQLENKDGFSYQLFSCVTFSLSDFVAVSWNRLNIVEGSYSQNPYFGDSYDLRLFCRIGTEEQLQRILRRNGPEKLQMFRERWIPMENKYFEAFEIEKKSMVIDCTGFSR